MVFIVYGSDHIQADFNLSLLMILLPSSNNKMKGN